MLWPYEKPKVPDAAAIPRARIAEVRRRTFAWLTPSQEPWNWCQSPDCGTRTEVSYDPELRLHLCRSCWLKTPRPKASKVTTSQPEPAEEPEIE